MGIHQINTLRQYLQDTDGEHHPLKDHILADRDDYRKNFYMKSLCMMATLDGALGDEQVFLLQQMIVGMQCPYGAEEYIRQGREMGDGDIRELMEEILQGDLAYSFFFDLMILHHIAPIQSHTSAFLEEMAEGLRLQATAVIKLTEVFTAILKEEQAYEPTELPDESIIRITVPYLNLCDMHIKCVNDKHCYLRYTKMVDRYIDSKLLEGKIVYLENISSDRAIIFRDCPKVHLHKCDFKGCKSILLQFIGDVKCVITSCHFEDCYREYASSRRDWIKESQLFSFSSVAEFYGWSTSNIFDESEDEEPVYTLEIRDSNFMRCGGKNKNDSFRSAIIGGEHTTLVENCTFEDCWHYHNTNEKDLYSRCTLFAPDTKNVNNTVINSTKFQ